MKILCTTLTSERGGGERVCVREKMRGDTMRERGRDRQSDRQTDGETGRETDRVTDRETDRETRETDRQTEHRTTLNIFFVIPFNNLNDKLTLPMLA